MHAVTAQSASVFVWPMEKDGTSYLIKNPLRSVHTVAALSSYSLLVVKIKALLLVILVTYTYNYVVLNLLTLSAHALEGYGTQLCPSVCLSVCHSSRRSHFNYWILKPVYRRYFLALKLRDKAFGHQKARILTATSAN